MTLKSLFFETAIHMEVGGVKVSEEDTTCPMRMWNSSVEALTCVKRLTDIAPCYSALVSELNKHQYDGKLNDDTLLFIN